MQDW